MKKESLIMGIAGLVFGFILGIATPKLFGTKTAMAPAPPPPQEEQFAPKGKPSLEQMEHAIKHYKEFLKKDPNNKEALKELGDVYYAAQRFNEAIDSYNKVLEQDDKNYEIYVQIGNVYYDSNQPQKAIEHYQKALELRPELSDTRVDMATMYRQAKQPKKAIEELKRVTKSDPGHAVAFLNLGIILKYDLKDLAGAKEAWTGYLKIRPNGPEADQVKEMIAKLDKEIAGQGEKPTAK